jgi:hypothetical protein
MKSDLKVIYEVENIFRQLYYNIVIQKRGVFQFFLISPLCSSNIKRDINGKW